MTTAHPRPAAEAGPDAGRTSLGSAFTRLELPRGEQARARPPRAATSRHELLAPWRLALAVAILSFALMAPIATSVRTSYDGARMKEVAVSIATHGTPLVRQQGDQLGLNTPYSTYGIGTSAVMAPLYRFGTLFGSHDATFMKLASPLLLALTAAVLVETLRRRGFSVRVIVVTMLVVVAGTPLVVYGITDFSEPGVALMMACAVLALDGVGRGTRAAALGAGAAAGGALLFRTDSLVLVALPVAVATLVLTRDRGRAALAFGAGIAPALLLWGWYNAARFGSPFDGGYHGQPFDTPFTKGLYGLIASPGRGLFVYAPVVLVAVFVIPRLGGADRVVGLFALALVGLRLVFYARWWAWYGGAVWGPRFMVPVLPAFAPLVAAAITRWRNARLLIVAGLLGIALSVVGTFATVFPGYDPFPLPGWSRAPGAAEYIEQVTEPSYVRHADNVLFDWSRFPAG